MLTSIRNFLIKLLAGNRTVVLNAKISSDIGIDLRNCDRAFVKNVHITNVGTGFKVSA